MALDPALRVALADPRGNINPNLDSLSIDELGALILGGGAAASLNNFLEMRLHVPGLNDGDLVAALNGFTRWGGMGQAAFYTGPMWAYRAGAAGMLYRQVNGRRALEPQPAAGAFSTAYLRPYALTGTTLFASDFSPNWMATTASMVEGATPTPLAMEVAGVFRKVVGGDGSTCRFTFGFADNTFLSPTAEVARCGLMGDGLGGYGYGSVNCPLGDGAVENAHTDHDANFVQPADLVAPGANWWSSVIKLVPPTPQTAGFWSVRHNGTLIATFTSNVNFPQGSGGVSHDYNRIEGLWMTNEGSQGRVPLTAFCQARLTSDLNA
jgi:hypothetical protein